MPDAVDDRDMSLPKDSPFTDVPIEIKVSVGNARPRIRELLELTQDSVLPLDKRLEDPVDLYIGDKLIARGELQELDDGDGNTLAVRLTEVVAQHPRS